VSALLDHEAIELLKDDPELLAVADAIVSARQRRTSRRLPWIASTAAAVAAAVAVALLAPWSGGGAPTLARALAALGKEPVIHLIARTPLTGAARHPAELQTETWYDSVHRLLHTIVRRNGSVVEDVLISRVVTIRPSGTTRTLPRAHVSPPLIEPALADFATRYRSDLASGRARVVSRGSAGGRPVVWLAFARPARTLEVAVDHRTYKPVLLRLLVHGRRTGPDQQIVAAETLPLGSGNFRAPRHAR